MLHCIMMCTNTVVSSILCRFIHSFGQECPFTNLQTNLKCLLLPLIALKNNNNPKHHATPWPGKPMEWPGKPNIMLPKCPTLNLYWKSCVYTNKSKLGNLMFLLYIDKLCATFLVSYPTHSYHPVQWLILYAKTEEEDLEYFTSLVSTWVDRRRLW